MRSRPPQHPILPPASAANPDEASAAAKIFRFEAGLFAVEIGPVALPPQTVGGIALPLIQVAPLPFDGDGDGDGDVEILGEAGSGEAWLGAAGGVVVVRAPPSGGAIVVTAFGPLGSRPVAPAIRVERLGGQHAAWQRAAPAHAPLASRDRDVPLEILLHVERAGDCRFGGGGWVGPRGRGLRIEGFAITPLAALSPRDLEYKAFQPGGAETPWVAGAQFCGTRGRRLPLTGFALRLAAPLAGRWSVGYSGAFLHGGVIGPCRDGEPCRPTLLDDPLEAISVSIAPGPGAGG